MIGESYFICTVIVNHQTKNMATGTFNQNFLHEKILESLINQAEKDWKI